MPPDLRAALAQILASACANLEIIPPISDAADFARAIASRLANLDQPGLSTETRRLLASTMGNARTLAAFLGPQPGPGQARLRSGEVADAILALGKELWTMVPIDYARWVEVAELVRQLP